MKNKKIIIIIPILFIFLSGSYFDYDRIIEKQFESAKKEFEEYIPEKSKNSLEQMGLDEISLESINAISLNELFKKILSETISQIKSPIKIIASITAASLICAVAESFGEELSQNKTVINVIGAISSAGCILIPMKETIISSGKVIEECSSFMLSFVPVYSSAIVASGNFSSSVGFRSVMLGACSIISRTASEIIIPLLCIYLALCVAGSISEINIVEISNSFKKFAVWLLTLSATVFSGIMGLGTIISSSADRSISKTAKFLVGSTIPVVGGTVSDALSAMKTCLEMTKNILGYYAIIIIVVVFIPPLIDLAIWRICLFISSGISSIFGNNKLSGLLSASSGVLGIMLALVAMTAVLFIFSVAIMLTVGSGG